MKRALFLIMAILVIIPACTKKVSNPVLGTWTLIYAKQVSGDSVTASFPGSYNGSQVKMWNDDYWMFSGRFTSDTVTAASFGGGTYSLDGVIYRETIRYHTSVALIDSTILMRVVVRNDTLIQVWPAHADGEVDKSNYSCERYVRLK